jgi:hypothetical protein
MPRMRPCGRCNRQSPGRSGISTATGTCAGTPVGSWGVGGAVAAPAYAAVAARPAAGPCTCLAKEYTPDNLVVFKDRCTSEMAAAPVGGQQQSQAQPGDVEPAPQK